MIKKIKGEYVVMSEPSSFGRRSKGLGEHTGRVFGRYKKKADAVKRLRQVEFFKHVHPVPRRGILKRKTRA